MKRRQTHNRKTKIIVFFLTVIAIFLLSATPAKSRNVFETKYPGKKLAKAAAFDEKSRILNLGVGLGFRSYYSSYRGSGYSYRSTPAISLSYEQSLPNKLGPGYLGVGLYFGYRSESSRYNDYFFEGNKYYYKHTWRHTVFGLRAAYHADALNFDKGEIYFGLMAGLRNSKYIFDSDSPDGNISYYYYRSSRNWYYAYSFFGGARYYLTDNLALFGELGYGISYITAGLSLKF